MADFLDDISLVVGGTPAGDLPAIYMPVWKRVTGVQMDFTITFVTDEYQHDGVNGIIYHKNTNYNHSGTAVANTRVFPSGNGTTGSAGEFSVTGSDLHPQHYLSAILTAGFTFPDGEDNVTVTETVYPTPGPPVVTVDTYTNTVVGVGSVRLERDAWQAAYSGLRKNVPGLVNAGVPTPRPLHNYPANFPTPPFYLFPEGGSVLVEFEDTIGTPGPPSSVGTTLYSHYELSYTITVLT